MEQDVTSLVIQIDSQGVVTASGRLSDFSKSGASAEKATDSLVGSLKDLALAYLSLEGAMKFLEKLTDTGKEFQVLEAQIQTATGSVSGAHEAFLALQELTAQTPFTLAQMTNAFTDLVNKGLDPSAAALKSYANTATALNVALDTVTSAIIGASNGMYRSMLALGIKVKETADGLVLTYRGASTSIRKDSADIEAYVQNLGNTAFADATANRMSGLEGATIQLKKAWDDLFVSINEQGAADLIAAGFATATQALVDFTNLISSGELKGYVDALLFKFSSLTDGISVGFSALTEVIEDAFKYWSTDGASTANFIIDAFKNMPENIRAYVEVTGARLGALVEYAEAVGKGIYDAISAWFSYLIDTATNVGKKIADVIRHPFDGTFDYTAAQGAAFDKFADEAVAAFGRTKQTIDDTNDSFDETVVSILNERDAAINAFKLQTDAASKLGETYKALAETRRAAAASNDPLAKNKPTGGNTHINSAADIAAYEALVKELSLEEDAIAQSYKRRSDLIINNTVGDNVLRLELEKELDTKVTAEYETAFQNRKATVLKLQQELDDAIASGHDADADALRVALAKEEEDINASYLKRRQAILDDTTTTEEQKLALLNKLEQKYTKQQQDFDVASQKASLDRAANFFGSLASIAGAFGAKGAKIAKDAAIVQTTIKTYESATSAYSSLAGIPYIGPVLGAAAAAAAIAAGMANVAAIRAQTVGAYDSGGMIPAGAFGMVGELGPELVRGPAVVTSRRTTADMGKDGASPQKVSVNVINLAGAETNVTETDTSNGKIIQIVIAKTKADLAKGINTGGDIVSQAIERSYGLRRGAA